MASAGGIAAGATLALSGVAQAAPQTYTVGTTADSSSGGDCTTAGNSNCSLREAVDLANNNSGADTILFNSSLSGQTITLTTGQIPITEEVTITGPGASSLTVDGNSSDRVFYINLISADHPVTISGLTMTNGYQGTDNGGVVENLNSYLTISDAVISHGYSSDQGGGVYSANGSLTIRRSTVSDSYAYDGGGLATYVGDLTITDSAITGNQAFGSGALNNYEFGYGGGVFVGRQTNLDLGRSTIYDNTAAAGGGVWADHGSSNSVGVTESTIAGNHAVTYDGGGVWVAYHTSLTVNGSTVTGNDAGTYGGGLLSRSTPPATATVEDSIVSGNTAGSDPSAADLHGTYQGTTQYYFYTAFSLIGVPNSYLHDDVPGSNLTGVDPKLGPLQDNGGLTETRAPLCGSPAIDAGKSFDGGEDQRALPRPVDLADHPNAPDGDGSDMGALELQTSPGTVCTPPPGGGGAAPTPTPGTTKKKKCKKKKHKHSADAAKKKCKKKKKKK